MRLRLARPAVLELWPELDNKVASFALSQADIGATQTQLNATAGLMSSD